MEIKTDQYDWAKELTIADVFIWFDLHMLKSINILNFALVHRLQMNFEPGLNIVTGETGSGKSLLIEALSLIAGGRASPDFLRTGEERSYVEAVFDRPSQSALVQVCENVGLDISDEDLLIRREIAATGKGRTFINDHIATVSTLRLIRPFLIDIHGQGDQQTLIDPSTHCQVLDLFASERAAADEVARLFQNLKRTRQKIAALQKTESERLRQTDMLTFQREEIERANIQSDEDAILEKERVLLENAERLAALSSGGYHLLYESEASILSLLSNLIRKIEEIAALDPSVEEHISALHTARYALEDIAYFLRTYAERTVISPERLRELERRLVDLDKLKRKYGPSLSDVLNTFQKISHALDEERADNAQLERLILESKCLASEYELRAAVLSSARLDAGRALERLISDELRQLALEDARFVVQVQAGAYRQDESRWTANGFDSIEFLFSPNPGDAARPLARVVSGGELSRLMLAVKSVLSPADNPRTIVFDEVDVGIGGRVAEAVGVRLKRLSQRQQVLCITHQPQIARFGDIHCKVFKTIKDGRPQTEIFRLGEEQRVEELARMMGGAVVTELTRRTAREMLTQERI